jgi:hypothetical protein
MAAILVGLQNCRIKFWKGTIQGLLPQSLNPIGPVVSEEIFCQYFLFFVMAAILDGCVWSLDIILKGYHPRTISAKSGQNWPKIQQKINLKTISETTGPIVTKIWGIGSWMVLFRSVSDVPACQPRRLSFLRVENSAKNHKSPLTLLGPYLCGMGGSPAYHNFIRTIPTAHRDGHHH